VPCGTATISAVTLPMKALAFWSVTALAAFSVAMLALVPLSPSGPPHEPAKKVATASAQLPTPPVRSHVTTSPLPTPAPTHIREEQSQQLQLEIGRALASADDADRERAYQQLLPKLIATDPAALKRMVATYPAGPIREQLLRHTAHTWSAVDLPGAIAFAQGVNEDSERLVAATEIVSQVGQADPGHAIEVSDVLGVGRNDGTVEHIAQLWANQNLQAALDWTEAQPPGPQRDQILARIVTVEADRSPAEAANTVLQQMSPGPAQTNAIAPIVREWAIRDTAAASTWIQDLPQGPLRDLANGELARTVRDRAVASVGSP
jgi:hypothetical protein